MALSSLASSAALAHESPPELGKVEGPVGLSTTGDAIGRGGGVVWTEEGPGWAWGVGTAGGGGAITGVGSGSPKISIKKERKECSYITH